MSWCCLTNPPPYVSNNNNASPLDMIMPMPAERVVPVPRRDETDREKKTSFVDFFTKTVTQPIVRRMLDNDKIYDKFSELRTKVKPIIECEEFLNYDLDTRYLFCLDNMELLDNIEFLDMSYVESSGIPKLTAIPVDVKYLKKIIRFYFAGNKITDLTPATTIKSVLLVINGDGNKITRVPPEIREWTCVTHLHLDDNEIESFPVEFGELSMLQRFFAERNQLSIVKDAEGNPITDVEGNQVSTMPDVFDRLENLHIVHLRGNKPDFILPASARRHEYGQYFGI